MATIDEVIEKYVNLRDELDTSRRDFKAIENDLKEKMTTLSLWLREQSDELGVDSFKTHHGTAYRVTKDFVRVGNWQKTLDFIKETENWQFLEKRLGKIAVKEYMSENGGVPPGVEYSTEIEFQIRKPN